MPTRGFLSHLDLNVDDLERAVAFYDLLLGYLGMDRIEPSVPVADRASWRLVGLDGAHFEIEVRSARGPAEHNRHVRNDPGIDHLAFHAASIADVDGIFKLLQRHGYHVDEPPRSYEYTPGYYAVGFDDPDGIRLEVVFDPTTNP